MILIIRFAWKQNHLKEDQIFYSKMLFGQKFWKQGTLVTCANFDNFLGLSGLISEVLFGGFRCTLPLLTLIYARCSKTINCLFPTEKTKPRLKLSKFSSANFLKQKKFENYKTTWKNSILKKSEMINYDPKCPMWHKNINFAPKM